MCQQFGLDSAATLSGQGYALVQAIAGCNMSFTSAIWASWYLRQRGMTAALFAVGVITALVDALAVRRAGRLGRE